MESKASKRILAPPGEAKLIDGHFQGREIVALLQAPVTVLFRDPTTAVVTIAASGLGQAELVVDEGVHLHGAGQAGLVVVSVGLTCAWSTTSAPARVTPTTTSLDAVHAQAWRVDAAVRGGGSRGYAVCCALSGETD